jgi:hypothetical protein
MLLGFTWRTARNASPVRGFALKACVIPVSLHPATVLHKKRHESKGKLSGRRAAVGFIVFVSQQFSRSYSLSLPM